MDVARLATVAAIRPIQAIRSHNRLPLPPTFARVALKSSNYTVSYHSVWICLEQEMESSELVPDPTSCRIREHHSGL